MTNETMTMHSEIANRANKMGLLMFDKLSLLMDLEAAQIKFNLDCEKLLEADELNFIHDIWGIQQNIDRRATSFHSNPPKVVFDETFLPRYSRPVEVAQ